MPQGIAQKILSDHLVSGKLAPGEEIAIRVDQTLTQDATGTMAYLQFEAMKRSKVSTKLSVSYVDHNTLQTGFENADDHRYLQSVAARYGVLFSRPGNGICHQVHLERFSIPGETLLGSDSHTPTCGGAGMLAIGVGGLDVAAAMAGEPFHLTMPEIVLVRLTGALRPWVSAKDIILELLRRLGVKGGLGKLFEYGGPGVAALTVTERATITNMGAELGATSSVFPSDSRTRRFFSAQGRRRDWRLLAADAGAEYDEVMELCLSDVEPLIALPHSPGNVKKVSEAEGEEVVQVCVGSCTNSSYHDLMTVARLLRGKTVHPDVSMTVSPGSRQVCEMLARNGALADLVRAGARVLECACGPCIGMGQAPPTGAVSLRTFNRNFEGRSGTASARVYLCSPATAAAAALTGRITDPRKLGRPPRVAMPLRFRVDDGGFLKPPRDRSKVKILRGPNIKPIPRGRPPGDSISGEVLIKVGDDITTDDIMPAGAKILPLRSNIPAIAEHVYERLDPDFPKRARAASGGFIVGGRNYGQGSSREHAALAPMFLGVKAVIAKSFARIHRSNLINFGIIPLTFDTEGDYDALQQGDKLRLAGVRKGLRETGAVEVVNVTRGGSFRARHDLSPREAKIVLSGGLLRLIAGKKS